MVLIGCGAANVPPSKLGYNRGESMKLTARQRRVIDPPRETDVPSFPVKKFTVAEYHKLLKVGIFRSGDPYELLKGWIVPKLRRSPRNASTLNRLRHRFVDMFPEDE